VLSEREQQVLKDIERHLSESDPKLAARLARSKRLIRWRGLLMLVLGWLLAVGAGLAGWWIVTVLLLGPLTALTLGWALNATR
jgi:hypothetical protein